MNDIANITVRETTNEERTPVYEIMNGEDLIGAIMEVPVPNSYQIVLVAWAHDWDAEVGDPSLPLCLGVGGGYDDYKDEIIRRAREAQHA